MSTFRSAYYITLLSSSLSLISALISGDILNKEKRMSTLASGLSARAISIDE